jgi:hypothetical protein
MRRDFAGYKESDSDVCVRFLAMKQVLAEFGALVCDGNPQPVF